MMNFDNVDRFAPALPEDTILVDFADEYDEDGHQKFYVYYEPKIITENYLLSLTTIKELEIIRQLCDDRILALRSERGNAGRNLEWDVLGDN